MDFKNKYWINTKFNQRIRIVKGSKSLLLENESESTANVLCTSSIKSEKGFLRILFKGKVMSEAGYCSLDIYNSKREKVGSLILDSNSVIETKNKRFFFVIKIQSKTKVVLEEIEINELESVDSFYDSINFTDFLIVTPSYPSPENKYLSGFVHSRLKAYKKAGIRFTLVCSFYHQEYSKYEFEGIEVIKVPFEGLRTIMRLNNFNKVAIHFFDWNYARILDASNLLDKEIYLWVHGPETLYWDWPYFTTRYFKRIDTISSEQETRFKENDKILQRYNDMGNVHWIFVSDWIKMHSEELTGIKFQKFSIIPNFIDENNFSYQIKDLEQRKKIFMLRRYDDVNKYAVDIAVRAILELSRKDFFNDLEFNIYGTGNFFDTLFSPLLSFSNVKFYRDFLTHKEIGEIHKQNGVGFFPTRYDAQGVSMCEAASSGLAIISSCNEAVREFIPSVEGNIVETEDYLGYAAQIEKLYKDKKYFLKLSKMCSSKVLKKCSYKQTISKEIELFKKSTPPNLNNLTIPSEESRKTSQKILSVIVPSYNVQNFLKICVNSLLNHPNKNYVEVLIVNDGSTDNTLNIARELEKSWNLLGENLVRVINKENGGYGSTINVGIREVSGKYVRVVDSDDWVDSSDFNRLIDILKKEDSDLVLTNYSEDRVEFPYLLKQYPYEMLTPGIKYRLDDLCSKSSYGFNKWGPIVATSNFKAKLLRETDFYLTEKSPYVDMEFNMYSIRNIETVIYYDLDIYRYLIGRVGQTISRDSYIKNFLKHENILFNMIDYMSSKSTMSERKKDYVNSMLIDPMIGAQYLILRDYLKSPLKFKAFDLRLKKYPYYYYNSQSAHKLDILLGRKTGGFSILFTPIYNALSKNKFLDSLAVKLKKIILKK